MRSNWRALGVCALLFAAGTLTYAQDAAQRAVPVYIGPEIRDGFVDIDQGVSDSIKDIQNELRLDRQFIIARTREEATIRLIVLGRGIVTNGSLGFGSSHAGTGTAFVVPNTVPTISTVLRVAAYEKRLHSEGGTWRNAAQQVVRDLKAWFEANRDRLPEK